MKLSSIGQVKVSIAQRAFHLETRSQLLEHLLDTYEARHKECITRTDTLPRKYVVVRVQEWVAGLGNNLPSVVTGDFLSPARLSNIT